MTSALWLSLFLGAIAWAGDLEPIAELGAAPSWDLSGGASIGPTVAVEVTPIEHWLELEAGVTPSFSHHSTEWGTDLLFKKPWTLSKKVEFMAGIGPEWIHEKGANLLAGEAALDFMFWPTRKRRFGWYVEPGYEWHGHDRSAEVSGGLLIALP